MGDMFNALASAGLLILAIVLFVALTIACEIGFRAGRWHGQTIGKKAEEENASTGTVAAGMLGLLAFILGLTINFAQTRFEARRELVAVEANTIGTAWLRARMIGGPDGDALAGEIHDYAKTRLAFTEARTPKPLPGLIKATGDEQDRIWALTTRIARTAPSPISATLVNAVNDMIDASLSQRFAFDGRVPGDMVAMLCVGSLLAIGAMGFQLGLTGVRQQTLTSLLLLMWTGGIVMTVDLERPRLGSVRVEATPLRWTIQGFESAPANPSRP